MLKFFLKFNFLPNVKPPLISPAPLRIDQGRHFQKRRPASTFRTANTLFFRLSVPKLGMRFPCTTLDCST